MSLLFALPTPKRSHPPKASGRLDSLELDSRCTEETVTRIRCAHPARVVSIERQGIGGKIFTPIDLLNLCWRAVACAESNSARVNLQAQLPRMLQLFRRVHVSLHFAKCDWRFCQRAVRVKNQCSNLSSLAGSVPSTTDVRIRRSHRDPDHRRDLSSRRCRRTEDGPAPPRAPPPARQRLVHPPPQLDCAFESICETCSYFQTSIEFRPTLTAPARPRRRPQPDRPAGTLRPARQPDRRQPSIMIRLTAITCIMPNERTLLLHMLMRRSACTFAIGNLVGGGGPSA